jgi:regulatory protein
METKIIPEWVLKKMYQYCAYQERSQFDVLEKLRTLPLEERVIEAVILYLRKENFINDERFAKTYARGKFYNNKWGRNKIRLGLKSKHIPDLLIEIGLGEIDGKEYEDVLCRILHKVDVAKNEKNLQRRKQKLYNYARSKGYESHLIWQAIDKIVSYDKE